MLNLALNLFLLLQTIQVVHNIKLNAHFTSVWCKEYDKEYVETMECFISTDPAGKQTMNAVLVLRKDLTRIENKYRLLVDLKQTNGTYLSLDLNICEALSSSFTNVVTRLISQEIHRVSNLPYECPLKKNFRYVINNFMINTKFLPSFTPDLKWYSNSDFYVKQRKILTFDSYGVVDRELILFNLVINLKKVIRNISKLSQLCCFKFNFVFNKRTKVLGYIIKEY